MRLDFYHVLADNLLEPKERFEALVLLGGFFRSVDLAAHARELLPYSAQEVTRLAEAVAEQLLDSELTTIETEPGMHLVESLATDLYVIIEEPGLQWKLRGVISLLERRRASYRAAERRKQRARQAALEQQGARAGFNVQRRFRPSLDGSARLGGTASRPC
jgi:hypothetical protein